MPKDLQKKVPFWVKTVLLGQEVHYYMVYIAYFTELNSKIENTRKNDAFVAKIVNTRLTKGFMAILPPPKSCQVLPPCPKETSSTAFSC